ncbi:MAG: Gfo/Idh/MocA family oxidoreductase [Planctomycetes bacterium]|nr:Gfo/Idh/MocA family oxidoreductase [Planctomycetota bacterium]
MVLDDRQKQVGKDNYADAMRLTRRQMLTGALAVPTATGMYFGYEHMEGGPVKAALIGTGNQGCYAHIGQSNPEFVKFVAFSDIRPSNIARGRQYFRDKYGPEAQSIRHYDSYEEMIDKEEEVELVVIALPLFLHAPATSYALKKGKHVLCEKLMAGTVQECKEMVRAGDEAQRFLAIGHQRHYSYMYANALSIIEQKILGDIRHIRAYWHRNQTINPATGVPGAEGAEMGKFDSWYPGIPAEDSNVDFKKFGYDSIEQLVRWRVDTRTGGGLMVELGSHQLDACSIFLKHALPKAVHGTGVISFFKNDRQVPDHVFLIYEYDKKDNDAVVMYSSISTNTFEGYGEQVMGTKGTLILNSEAEAYLFAENADKNTRISWAEARVSRPAAASGSTRQWGGAVTVADTLSSRGYREEQEHLAWLIRNVKQPDGNPEHMPRCHGRVALSDAVVTLVSNLAMKHERRVAFKPEWFDPASDAVPETDPDVIGKA